jgi:hypothetical protein
MTRYEFGPGLREGRKRKERTKERKGCREV